GADDAELGRPRRSDRLLAPDDRPARPRGLAGAGGGQPADGGPRSPRDAGLDVQGPGGGQEGAAAEPQAPARAGGAGTARPPGGGARRAPAAFGARRPGAPDRLRQRREPAYRAGGGAAA